MLFSPTAVYEELPVLTVTPRELYEDLTAVLLDMRRGEEHAFLQVSLNRFEALEGADGKRASEAAVEPLTARFCQQLGPRDRLAYAGDGCFLFLVSDDAEGRAGRVARLLRNALQHYSFEEDRGPANIEAAFGLVYWTGANLEANEVVDAATQACKAAQQRCGNHIETRSLG